MEMLDALEKSITVRTATWNVCNETNITSFAICDKEHIKKQKRRDTEYYQEYKYFCVGHDAI